MRFAGTTVIITGAAGGLGSVIAAAFAADGGRVALVDLPGSRGAAVAYRINQAGPAGSAFFVPCDLADLAGTAEVIGGVVAGDGGGVLVNNAAIYPSKAVSEYSIGEWQRGQRGNVEQGFGR